MSDYEKKYKEALARAREIHLSNDEMEYLFPELKESDDERIREVLVDYFKKYKEQEECGIKTFYGIPADDILAWLEKQGVQPRYNIGDILCDKLCTTLNKDAQPNMEIVDIKNGMYICDKGSFPVSQQDEYVLAGKRIDSKLNDNSVSNELRTASFAHAKKEILNRTFPNDEEFELAYMFEKGAKWDAAQHIHAWCEADDDDIAMVESRLYDLLNYTREDGSLTKHRKESIKKEVNYYVSWLKSIKDRCTWKPSDAQMEELNYVVNLMGASKFPCENDYCYNVLKSLRDQLKKLK